jgi:ribosomal protein S18 acetylase RimI-like enzyme
MNTVIREAIASDCGQIINLFIQVDKTHAEELPEVFNFPDAYTKTEESIKVILNNKTQKLFVAENEGMIVGVIYAILHSLPPDSNLKNKVFVMVDTLVVDKLYREKGLGRKLMDKVKEWAKNNDATEIKLNVWNFNKSAISFYEKLGYNIQSIRMAKNI